jgi:ketosteroid isomerase-like protein
MNYVQMKKISLLLFLVGSVLFAQKEEKKIIIKILDDWHAAAGAANFDAYFGLMTDDAVFIGTDAMENWQRDDFIEYAKPHFNKGKAWDFTAVYRNVYISSDSEFAWFDELLDTQMKICRGSGVLKKVDGEWKIAHYVLSIAVPNEFVDELVKIKDKTDSALLKELKMR